MERHYKKDVKLDNCKLLKDLRVRVPEEYLHLSGRIRELFADIEKFYAKFLKIEDFTKDLTVEFHLKGPMTQAGSFVCCHCRTGKPVINIYSIDWAFKFNGVAGTLAHEFAHFMAWRLGRLQGLFGDISRRRGTVENGLALKFGSYNELKPGGMPFGGITGDSLMEPDELFARYLEQYYNYCFLPAPDPEQLKKMEKHKNCSYVRRSDFEKGLLGPISEYLDFMPPEGKHVELDIA